MSNPQKSPNVAMEDDTQDAVRQGIRKGARTKWGYDICFWEMGAKLMLQPEVGQHGGRRSIRSIGRSRDRIDRFDRFDKFSDLLPCRGAQDLPVVQVSALYDAWRSKKRRKFRRRKKKVGKKFGWKNQFFVNLVRFWRSYGRTDVKISFSVKFGSR